MPRTGAGAGEPLLRKPDGGVIHMPLEIARADLAKKDAELVAAHGERDRVSRALEWFRGRGGRS